MRFLNFAIASSWLFMVSSAAADKAAKEAPPPGPAYTSATEIDVTGTVKDVREVPAGKPMDGLHLTLRVGTGTLDVYVGPTEFVKIFGVAFAKGAEVRVIGSKVEFEGSTVVLARDVILGEVTLSCRDKDGEPLWKFFIKPAQG